VLVNSDWTVVKNCVENIISQAESLQEKHLNWNFLRFNLFRRPFHMKNKSYQTEIVKKIVQRMLFRNKIVLEKLHLDLIGTCCVSTNLGGPFT